MEENVENEREEEEVKGVASIALLPCGSISGHFIHLPHSVCYGLHGTELACERECSQGEDYQLIKLTIIDYNKEQSVVVECRGHDAAWFRNINHAHGWENDIVGMVEKENGKKKILVSFECKSLKADKAAEDHIRQFMPKLIGLRAVVKIGRMSISGRSFEDDENKPEEEITVQEFLLGPHINLLYAGVYPFSCFKLCIRRTVWSMFCNRFWLTRSQE